MSREGAHGQKATEEMNCSCINWLVSDITGAVQVDEDHPLRLFAAANGWTWSFASHRDVVARAQLSHDQSRRSME